MVNRFLAQPTRTSALSIQTKVLAALRFYASGSYQEITGSNSFVAISQASASRAVNEVTNALNQPEILNNVIRFPRNIEELENIRTRFYESYQFPGIIGCIDCTHVSIVAPPANDEHAPEHIYVNRKNYHSLNVQLICDNNLKLLNVTSRFPGSTHDAHIWRQSAVSNLMEQLYRRDPTNVFFLLGDSGYPTRPWLLTPILNPQNVGQQRYNDRLCSIRSIIERCNGVLKNLFRCLLRYRTLHYHPTTAGKIVNACYILHNLCIERNIPEPDEPHIEEPDYGIYHNLNFVDNMPQLINPDLAVGRDLQLNIIANHFNE
ncbi:putative nuclease HARBI1 [Anoplophora glabripennis]|uniref:putative nuclease HARBI1 n=1 Tax=Anoplophora glabripennis TaxID=217634 RepID=UPI000C760770|nr:putative nuclease HARBI1 [Anoplophora glabripennis]